MSAGYYVLVAIHVLAAMLWLGGMLFFGIVGAPALRAIEPPALRQRLFQELGRRFRTVGWTAVATLVTTGVLMLGARGLLHWSVLGSVDFWRTTFGTTLALKLVAVATMIVVSAVHDFLHGPAAGRATPGSPTAIAMRRRAALLARANALVGILLVLAAVRLARS